jgi:hypothetical protein
MRRGDDLPQPPFSNPIAGKASRQSRSEQLIPIGEGAAQNARLLSKVIYFPHLGVTH